MKKKFKKILSLVTVVTLLVSMLSFWAIPASAEIEEGTIITPEDFIIVPEGIYYYEVILSGFTPGTYNVPLMIPHNFDVIIQSFGSSATHAPQLTLLDSSGTQVLCQGAQGFKRQGHKAQTLFSFNNAALGGGYILRITSTTSANMRLSITITNGDFYESPISQYEDIDVIGEASFTNRFYAGSPATIMRYQPSASGIHSISVSFYPSHFEGVRTLVMDPSTTEFYECVALEDTDSANAYFDAGETYYVVVYIPYDPNPDFPSFSGDIEYVDVTVNIL